MPSDLVDVTIRMPAAWVGCFWGWYLDGGGDSGFSETLSDGLPGYQIGETYGAQDKEQLLIVLSDRPITAEQKQRLSPAEEPSE